MTEYNRQDKSFDRDQPGQDNEGAILPRRWRREFPYHWDGDELISRRELLQFTVFTSGALFAGTSLLAILDALNTRRRGSPKTITTVDQLKEGQAFYFNYPDPDDQAMVIRLPGDRFVAYSQKCTHLSCSVYLQQEQNRLYCPCHDGVFDVSTGEPVAGPPQRRLPRITLRREGNNLIAVEEVP
ncbi:MAG TPA: Rieske 2Fe-2S domain-containing protein [Chloroflexia bacterium]|nr:Rieske 2Fe-2S domain-containing protein [Chloroflexia bacterium]